MLNYTTHTKKLKSNPAVTRKTGLTSKRIIRYDCLATAGFFNLNFTAMPNNHLNSVYAPEKQKKSVIELINEALVIIEKRSKIFDQIECVIKNIENTNTNFANNFQSTVELF